MKPHEVQQEVGDIQARNIRVEADKAWETSWTRRILITVGTYVVIGGYLTFLEVNRAWLHALVPPAAYLLSTLSLPVFKQVWVSHVYKGPAK